MPNQFNYHCPDCECDDELWIKAHMRFTAWLLPDGTDNDYTADTEWDDNDEAGCNLCGWIGKVSDLYPKQTIVICNKCAEQMDLIDAGEDDAGGQYSDWVCQTCGLSIEIRKGDKQ